MELVVAGIVLIVGLGALFLVASRDNAMGRGRPGTAAGSFLSGIAESHDPTAAMVALENEKRAAMEGEEDNGDGPDPGRLPVNP